MSILTDKRIMLGVTGSIAAYKAAVLASKLTQAGAQVDVILEPKNLLQRVPFNRLQAAAPIPTVISGATKRMCFMWGWDMLLIFWSLRRVQQTQSPGLLTARLTTY
jgi:hypothetical protein